ncbi:MAG TPA: PEGA domain-containing protein [Solirubrobacterales bacterium]|nr:PEGA domain-containing protein [Solirubrobacterales bacterium]
MKRPLLLAVVLALTAGTAGTAGAQPAQRPAEQQAADRHFKAGVARFKERKFAEALAEFQRANEIAPHPLVLYNIAGCYRELGRHGEAVKAYKKFLDEGIGRVPANRLAEAQTELASIYAAVARVTVQVEPAAGASLLLDGQPLGELPVDMPLFLSPGTYKLTARAPGHADAEQEIRIAAGETPTVTLSLPALAQDPVKPPPGPTVGTRPGPDQEIRVPVVPPATRAPKRFAVSFGFGTNALRVGETGAPAVGLALALGSRLELGVDATIVAYAIVPSVRVRLAGEALSLHAIVAAPIALTDGGEMETFVAGAAGLGLRMRIAALPGLALRLESYASFAGETHGTTIPTFLGGELWF